MCVPCHCNLIMNTEPHNFYVTLPSNTSTDTFPNNTPSEYTAKLSHRIELSGEWEVALHTISYVKWNTIKLNKESVHYVANNIKKTGSQLKDYYTNVEEYIADINASIPDKGKVVFTIQSGKVTVTLESGYSVHLRKEQAIILGFLRLMIRILLRRLPLRKQEVMRQICIVKQAFMSTVISLSHKSLEIELFLYWICLGQRKRKT